MSYNKSFAPKITAKGTELPLLDLRGKPYLQVAHRLVWFREEHPDWGISTELVAVSENETLSKATITDASGRIIATAHKRENTQGFPDHTEKSETGALGRALAMCGYGTQFEPEFDEAERLADAPIAPAKKAVSLVERPTATKEVGPGAREAKAGAAGREGNGTAEKEAAETRDKIKANIKSLAFIAVSTLKKTTQEGISDYIRSTFGKEKSDELTTEQLKQLSAHIESVCK